MVLMKAEYFSFGYQQFKAMYIIFWKSYYCFIHVNEVEIFVESISTVNYLNSQVVCWKTRYLNIHFGRQREKKKKTPSKLKND